MFKKFAITGILLFSAVCITNGQTDPAPTPYRSRPETSIEKIRRQDREHARIAQQSYNNLYGQGSYANSNRYNGKWRKRMVTLYRKPKKSEIAGFEPAESFKTEYASLLKKKDTGIFVIRPDQGCAANGEVISASPKCSAFNFPGSGSSFSFRFGSYRIRRLADISYVKTSLVSSGFFASAIYVVLGDVPLDSVSLKTPGMHFLEAVKASNTPAEAMFDAKRFARGVKSDGFLYGRGVLAKTNRTFAIRSIAYRGKFLRTELGVPYNELDFDKRRDVIVAFRIVDVGPDGAATIVWKILRNLKSPKMKVEESNK